MINFNNTNNIFIEANPSYSEIIKYYRNNITKEDIYKYTNLADNLVI